MAGDVLNKDNKALFIFGFVFYFIGDLATTHLTLVNGMYEGICLCPINEIYVFEVFASSQFDAYIFKRKS